MKIFFKFLFLLNFSLLIAQTTVINDTNFEQHLIDLGIDSNGLNGNILNTDAQTITILNISVSTITDFTGLEAFLNITSLDLGSNQFATLPLNTLTVLEELVFGNNDALASLDLSQNTALKKLDIGSLFSGALPHPPIASLDLSANILLENLKLFYYVNMTSLVLPTTNTLKKIDIYHLAVATLDLANQNGLEDFKLRGSAVPINVIFPNEHNVLKKVELGSITFLTVDLSNYMVLERLRLSSTGIENLTLPATSTFINLSIWGHNFINLVNLINVPNITHLDIRNNDGTPLVIDISTNLLLTNISLPNNDLNTVDLTNNTLLKRLDVSDNNLTTLDLTQNTNLENLNARYNQLPTIDLSQNIVLKQLNLSFNVIPTLDVTTNTLLESIIINNNLFTTNGLDLSQNAELYYFDASFNQIETLNILQNPKLLFLIINNNLFPGNDILNQYYQIRDANNGIIRGSLIVSFNQLTGTIPNYTTLIDTSSSNFSFWTRRFSFEFDNNNFEFGDFENQHLTYVSYLTTFIPSPYNSYVFSTYKYAPQAKVNNIENLTENAGNTITLTTVVRGTQNHYKWFKDGVQIVGALDSPNYTILNLDSCDAGIYHSEITSDLVPFENADPPGTNNKNLLLVRNDITLNINYTETCVNLAFPANGDINIPINTGLSWTGNLGACGYYINVGTTSGGTDIVNNVYVEDVSSYTLPSNLPSNIQIYVSITPYFQSGNTLTCSEEIFTTGTTQVVPNCTQLDSPANNAIDVAVDTDLTWTAINNADGYYISVGTTAGATNILNNFDVGNTTTYNPPANFTENQIYFVTVIAYNSVGNATGCVETSFTTETIAAIPNCTQLDSPADNVTGVIVDADLTWTAVNNADGYYISIGTTAGATDILNLFDVGNVTTYNPPTNFAGIQMYFVTVIAYNSVGNATICTETSFTTESLHPGCSYMVFPIYNAVNIPIDTNISWSTSINTTYYTIGIGTTIGSDDILTTLNVGNVTTFNPPMDLPANTEIHITITSYNDDSSLGGTVCGADMFTTAAETIPNCTMLISPLNGSISITLDTNLSWNAIANATGYNLSIGTSTGGTDLVNNQDLGNVTTFNPATDFPANTTIFVNITPYNAVGIAISCTEENFATATIPPNCTQLAAPTDTATNIAINTNLLWTAVANADGYYISIGTTSGATDILNNFDIVDGTITTYNPPINFAENQVYFVTVTAYNSVGNATGCVETSFATETIATIPNCTQLDNPADTATNVLITQDLTWIAVTNADGYYITIGTTIGGTNIEDNTDLGNETTYTPSNNWLENTTYFITITAYNSVGNAISCSETSFLTIATSINVEYMHFFTPNGNGENDYWHLLDTNVTKPNAKINIFNRFGKLMAQINPNSIGWDGNYNGVPLPSSEYWFNVELIDGSILKGNFSLLRK